MKRYIDADALIEELQHCSYETWSKGVNRTWWAQAVKVKDNIVKCIERQPTADVVEVRRGEWKKHFSYGHWHYDCPFCDDGFAVVKEFEINQLPHYCSNCGARMDGERRENDLQ